MQQANHKLLYKFKESCIGEYFYAALNASIPDPYMNKELGLEIWPPIWPPWYDHTKTYFELHQKYRVAEKLMDFFSQVKFLRFSPY